MSPYDDGKASPRGTGQILVEVMNGPEDGREILCARFPITIGRASENSIGLSCDHLISRHHARIGRSDEGFVLEDLKSTNGTFIGDKRIKKRVPLHIDELFRVGATLLRMRRPARKSAGREDSAR